MIRPFAPLTAWVAALVAALIGFGGTIALVVQAMRAMGADGSQIGSAVTALCLGIAVMGGLLSFRMRIPIILAWSTPGAALLAATADLPSWPVSIGIFISAAVLMILLGCIPLLGRWAERIPAAVASAMLAGVLLPFCLTLFNLAAVDPLLICVLLGLYIIARARLPLYALLLVLAAGFAMTLLRGGFTAGAVQTGQIFGTLSGTLPIWDARAIISIGLPLFLVTLASQNLPGLIVLRSAGYQPQAGRLLTSTGVASLLMAPFGAHGINLAAITAAICTTEEAHADARRRWIVGVIYAGFYLLMAALAPALVRIILALPPAVIAALTGFALIPALSGAMEGMLNQRSDREAAILTFLATGSGLALFGLGSAFWGLVVGFSALALQRLVQKR